MAVMEGSLSKWTNVMKGWQYRWFVLDENSGLLSYYTSKEKMMRGVRRGCVRLKGAVIGIDDEDDSTFTVTVDHKTFHFQARDAVERENWVRALEDTIARHSSRQSRWETNRPPPTMKDFDNKVSEADAYLQLMIDHTKKLEERVEANRDTDDRGHCQTILDQANAMLHNIKHSIVLLQIAKNTAHPVNGVYQARPDSSNMHSLISEDITDILSLPGLEPVQPGVELGSECLERRHSRSISVGAALPTLVVPDMSYSSSEGEEDFYDANDSPFGIGSQGGTPTGVHGASFISEEVSVAQLQLASPDSPSRSSTSPKISSRTDDGVDYDSLYNDDEEDEFSMESQGSVIRHLLSQVKIGMDLTKVVLPTFILERRSLLEMYADYFAHPDLFVRISEFKTPRERIVQVVKWYLSSYHAGRKSTVAKKPYNPILGEVFRCYWNVPQGNKQQADGVVSDGPVPWASSDQLTFVSEQVSHHPPISAFYAEHYNNRISFNAHIYTKSKFLGLSVCVYNIGEGVVSVLDYDEEYVVSFPNGYGRSILTIPWIELGGAVSIRCPQTGYYCELEFLTKPFYGNKKHKVHAEIYSPEDKKSFVSITGEWNGVMEAKWADEDKPTVFINVNALPVTTKLVSPISEQGENESRRVWMHVTRALKYNEIEKATSAKFKIEQRQREEAKERKESKSEWSTKLFHRENEEGWAFVRPLSGRLPRSN